MVLPSTSDLRACPQSLESSHSSPVFSIQSLLFVVAKVVLSRLYVPGSFEKPVGAEQALTVPGALA